MAESLWQRNKGCNNSIGYADGILEAGEWRWICNYKDKKKQRDICMDMLMVDVTEINCTEIRYNFMAAQPLLILQKLTIPMKC
jgi:alanine racemase